MLVKEKHSEATKQLEILKQQNIKSITDMINERIYSLKKSLRLWGVYRIRSVAYILRTVEYSKRKAIEEIPG